MNHKAIYALYPEVRSIDDETGAFDKDGIKVSIDMNKVNAWIDPNAYQHQRATAYPSLQDQFDLLYHGGFDAWKAAIDEVKNKYPKP